MAPSAPAATAAWVLLLCACHTSWPWNVSLKAANVAGLASSRTVTPCAGPAADGGTSANWSFRSLGFSTMPVTLWWCPGRDSTEPMWT